ncbi:MAG: tRNA (guanine(46)-N(7))-methyltransferase TrmB [Defluviicoccus sp.]
MNKKRLLATVLPRLAFPLPPPASVLSEPRALFDGAVRDVWLEIGFGAGEHLAGQALKHPDVGFIGCEPYVNGVAALIACIESLDLGNIRIFGDDARLLLPHLPDACLGQIFLLFADPWPKLRHADRRFIARPALDELARLLRPGGTFLFASDHPGYVRWTLWQVARHPAFAWPAQGPQDWRQPPPGWIETRYEAKAKAAGAVCTYLEFVRTNTAVAVA